MLVESMRSNLCNVLSESTQMTAKDATKHMKYVNENATYEQLLNITMNPDHATNYLPDYVLEGAVAILHRACMTGRKNIGVNAITEGALKLHHETGAVITESMLDAALNSVVNGKGLQIVGTILKEQAELMAKKPVVAESKKVAAPAVKKQAVTEGKKVVVPAAKKPVVAESKKVVAPAVKKQAVTEAKKVKKSACKCGKKNCKCK